jgi:hypothetical protein
MFSGCRSFGFVLWILLLKKVDLFLLGAPVGLGGGVFMGKETI